jgi:hypothetical protein
MTTQLQTSMKSPTTDSSEQQEESGLQRIYREKMTMHQVLRKKSMGSINQAGYLKSLYKKGFNRLKSILELLANCIDAKSTEIKFIVEEINTYMIDNGNGMDEENFENMMDVQRENHSTETSLGVSGVGGKIATLYLGGEEEVIYYSHKQGGRYLKLTIPWKDIFEKQIYTDMTDCEDMNDDEKIKFEEKTTNNTGTMIEFKSSNVLTNTLLENFKTKIIKYDEDMRNLTDSAPIVFGRFSELKITYKNYEDAQDIKTMNKYDYFSGEKTDYYLGTTEYIIEGWKNDKNRVRYIHTDAEGNRWEILSRGRGWSKKATKSTTNLTNYESFGKWDIYVGLRKDKSTFDPDHPGTLKQLKTKYKCAQNHFHNEYDKKYLVGELDNPKFAYINQWPLVRNGQEIGRIPCPGFAPSSARGSFETYVTYTTRVDIRYNPTSNQSNFQDKQMGIQENKNQFESGDIPLNFSRLVKHLRELKSDKILKYMKVTVTSNTIVRTPSGGGETKSESTTTRPGLVDGDFLLGLNVATPKDDVDAVVASKTDSSTTIVRTPSGGETKSESTTTRPGLVDGDFLLGLNVATPKDDVDAVASKTGASNTVQETLKKPENKVKIPSNVSAHRKGSVTRKEIMEAWEKATKNMTDNEKGYGECYLEVYNLLLKINNRNE